MHPDGASFTQGALLGKPIEADTGERCKQVRLTDEFFANYAIN